MSRKGCDINCPFWFQEACDPLHCPPEHTPHCSVCGEMMGWTVCSYCNGEGCVNCLGTGGEWECPDAWQTQHQEAYRKFQQQTRVARQSDDEITP